MFGQWQFVLGHLGFEPHYVVVDENVWQVARLTGQVVGQRGLGNAQDRGYLQ